jgi:dihydrofolate reductase
LVLSGWLLAHPYWAAGGLKAFPAHFQSTATSQLLVVGSAAIARWLLENELVDELNIVQCPVIVGEGERLFPQQGLDFALDLTDSRVFGTGIVALTYRVGGRPKYA